ncbi:hypothetical protein Sjap_023643 [Stephania japonica]|uniref:Uncharacterized protein n=1 Tax=Stephania japonica TaxID=461633 RepID=A0AAP0HN61_9MAGN
MSAAALAQNLVYHARTKHIELDIHYVRDKVLAGQLGIHHVPTQDQLADIFTKCFPVLGFNIYGTKLVSVWYPYV